MMAKLLLLAGCSHTSQKWYPWEETTSLPNATGNYYLTADVTLATALELYGTTEVKLCLNGLSPRTAPIFLFNNVG